MDQGRLDEVGEFPKVILLDEIFFTKTMCDPIHAKAATKPIIRIKKSSGRIRCRR